MQPSHTVAGQRGSWTRFTLDMTRLAEADRNRSDWLTLREEKKVVTRKRCEIAQHARHVSFSSRLFR